VGVKVKLSVCDPSAGTVAGVVHAKLPLTEATPPLRVEEERALPKLMAEAVGWVVMVGVDLPTEMLTVPVAVL
jgi:hypothetical protein